MRVALPVARVAVRRVQGAQSVPPRPRPSHRGKYKRTLAVVVQERGSRSSGWWAGRPERCWSTQERASRCPLSPEIHTRTPQRAARRQPPGTPDHTDRSSRARAPRENQNHAPWSGWCGPRCECRYYTLILPVWTHLSSTTPTKRGSAAGGSRPARPLPRPSGRLRLWTAQRTARAPGCASLGICECGQGCHRLSQGSGMAGLCTV